MMKSSGGKASLPSAKKAEDPLYQKVSNRIGELIEESPSNALLPSERELSTAFNVNRRTLRKALQPFVDKGVLERTPKGTYIRKNEENEWASVHPLNMFGFEAPGVQTRKPLRICMYQNYPLQRKFWEDTARRHNESNKNGTGVEIEWLPNELASSDAFHEHVRREAPDMVLLAYGPWNSRVINEVSEKMPDDVARLVFSEDFLTRTATPELPESSGFVPVALSLPCMAWNRAEAERQGIGAELEALKTGESPVDVFKKVANVVSKSEFKVAGHVADLMFDIGCAQTCDEEHVKAYLRRNFEAAARLPVEALEWFVSPFSRPYYIFESMGLLRQRRTLFSGGLLMYVSNLLASSSGEFDVAVPFAKGDETLSCEVTGLIVNAFGRNRDAAWDFARSMLSEEGQSSVAKDMQCCAMRKKSNESLPFAAGRQLDDVLSRANAGGGFVFNLGLELAAARREFFAGLISRTVTVEDALKKTMDWIRRRTK